MKSGGLRLNFTLSLDGVGQVQGVLMTGLGNNMFDPLGYYTHEQSIVTMVRLYDLFPH